MSDDEADPELLELLRETLGLGKKKAQDEVSTDTGVLRDAEYIYTNAIDVSIDMYGSKGAAASIYSTMQDRGYSTETWGQHELHPRLGDGFSDVDMVNFIFTMDLLNFSFWSELSDEERYQVDHRGKRWTGYNSLVACLQRALEEEIPITTPKFWIEQSCADGVLRHVFRSATNEEIPLLDKRIAILREAGEILGESFGDPDCGLRDEPTVAKYDRGMVDNGDAIADADSSHASTEPPQPQHSTLEEPTADVTSTAAKANSSVARDAQQQTEALTTAEETHTDAIPQPAGAELDSMGVRRKLLEPDLSVVRLIEKADHSAGKLVNLLAKHFPSFRDETRFDGKRVRLLKRAQIFVADLWAAFNGTSYGAFDDIDHLTMFADYRVPQMLRSLGVLVYSPPLNYAINSLKEIPSGHSWEVQLRGCSIWAVELIRREILRQHPEATGVNAVLIDFLLYDIAKEREAAGTGTAAFHRTRSIWY
ncbi:hypothetical protein LTR37_019491 [Vermiconidia calcicola]|uniref:Uncharacterized protein n=1 Tax=Vermiconidia calcicola TaxID=1690605 RepID=A0ACC3ME62_9PEZI|nr:hypothetical protein LTR37_019491 [Vermiconidia calcicola]